MWNFYDVSSGSGEGECYGRFVKDTTTSVLKVSTLYFLKSQTISLLKDRIQAFLTQWNHRFSKGTSLFTTKNKPKLKE